MSRKKETVKKQVPSSGSNFVSAKRLFDALDDISFTAQSSFGVAGRAVMIHQKSPKEITVTKVCEE